MRPRGDDLARTPPTEWRAHTSVAASAFVILALLALAVTPVLMTWRLDALHADGDATTGRAHHLTDRLKMGFVDEIVFLQQIGGDSARSAAAYGKLRASQDRIISDLRAVAPRISTVATARVDTVARFWARWPTMPNALASGRLSGKQVTNEMSRVLAHHDSMFAAAQQLDVEIEKVTVTRRAQIDSVLMVQRWLSSGLGVLAVTAAMVVAWFAQREQRLTRVLSRTLAISEQRRVDLETITESKNRLMRGFSHDVKNPIGAADGHLQLLADGILGPIVEKQRRSIERARRSLRAALHERKGVPRVPRDARADPQLSAGGGPARGALWRLPRSAYANHCGRRVSELRDSAVSRPLRHPDRHAPWHRGPTQARDVRHLPCRAHVEGQPNRLPELSQRDLRPRGSGRAPTRAPAPRPCGEHPGRRAVR